MKLYAPKYYLQFKCIADKCRHSCCVGWEIDIDCETMKKYSSMTGGYGINIKESIAEGEIPYFRLAEDERCPHLDRRGLCRIITNLGEDYLCSICREHPRFYNYTPLGREVGLGLACEEACRIILSSDSYADIAPIGEIEGELEQTEFDVIGIRARIFSLLSDKSVPYPERLRRISAEYSVSPADISDDDVRALFSSLEYLDESHKDLFLCYSSDIPSNPNYEEQLERALAYFIYRHCSESLDACGFRASLGLSLLCERLLASMLSSSDSDITDLAHIISEEIEYSEDNTETIKTEFLF